MSSDLRVGQFDEFFAKGWVVLADENIKGSNLVALVLFNRSGVTVYRHRPWIDVDKILGAINLDYVLMRRQVFDVSYQDKERLNGEAGNKP
jgi:hypothetical protein